MPGLERQRLEANLATAIDAPKSTIHGLLDNLRASPDETRLLVSIGLKDGRVLKALRDAIGTRDRVIDGNNPPSPIQDIANFAPSRDNDVRIASTAGVLGRLQDLGRSIGRIEAADSGELQGTGFVIGHSNSLGVIATNCHVIQNLVTRDGSAWRLNKDSHYQIDFGDDRRHASSSPLQISLPFRHLRAWTLDYWRWSRRALTALARCHRHWITRHS